MTTAQMMALYAAAAAATRGYESTGRFTGDVEPGPWIALIVLATLAVIAGVVAVVRWLTR